MDEAELKGKQPSKTAYPKEMDGLKVEARLKRRWGD